MQWQASDKNIPRGQKTVQPTKQEAMGGCSVYSINEPHIGAL